VTEEQLPLFTAGAGQPAQPEDATPTLSAHSSLRAAMAGFREHMLRIDLTENTVKSFLGDLSLLARRVGHETEIGGLDTKELRDFMDYLHHGRGVPCTTKSYGRRMTTLKVFFAWLASSGVIDHDPATTLIHQPAASPLPVILYDEQIELVLSAAHTLAGDAKNPDPRPVALVSLLLQTGIKKSECLALQVSHFDFSDPQAPVLQIRYADPRRHHKERRLALAPGFPPLLRRYLESYRLYTTVFACTGRNLEYVLHRVAQLAGLSSGLSFEMLRWTCAVRDFARMEPEQLRKKLGLSEMAWEDTLAKIQALTANPL
jgi:integrase/recombinase XerD